MDEKPHKGDIKDWTRMSFDIDHTREHYSEEPGLGFTVVGTFVNHPQFGYSPGGHTSWIVKLEGPDPEGNYEAETRNSRYRLLGEPLK